MNDGLAGLTKQETRLRYLSRGHEVDMNLLASIYQLEPLLNCVGMELIIILILYSRST